MAEEKYLRPKEVCNLLQISYSTLYNWEHQGKITSVKLPSGHNRYALSEILPPSTKNDKHKLKICYARVSSFSQKEDLERQVAVLRSNYPDYKVIKDYGSGLNFNRKGFNSILDEAIKGNIAQVVVTYKDRFCRFGFEFFERLLQKYSNGSILVLNKTDTSPEEELVGDLMAIVTVFSGRLYGLRSKEIRKQLRNSNAKTEEKKERNKIENIEVSNISNRRRKTKTSGDV